METEKHHKPPASPPPPPPESPPSSPPPPSLNSSPSHEFSFTISLHPPNPLSSDTTASTKLKEPAAPHPDLDLSPADEIFFHGHLLPLHFLSHRASNASIETEHKLCKNTDNKPSANRAIEGGVAAAASSNEEEFKEQTKAKPFFPFFALRKWLRGREDKEAEKQRKKKKKLLARLWKKYASLMEPLLFFKAMKEKRELRRSPYSFSGNCNPREGGWRRRWRGDFSAPASMRTSPANSGLLVAPSTTFSSSDESTMEELQNAIQAAIAHCKSSVAVKENKCGY